MDSGSTARTPPRDEDRVVSRNFVTDAVDADLRVGRVGEVVTRFPPEPNGYLHIGHAKAICLDFGVARDYGGRTYLRFDDTNPTTENPEFVDSIRNDVRWLGFAWTEERFASDYFGRLFELACRLIETGDAYVDSQPETEVRAQRGTVTEPGRPSPYRERPPEESLELFHGMRAGSFDEGAHVLRAKIDMASKNMLMRDPVLYRIRHQQHYRTGDAWHVYPLYDFAHPLSDAIEGVTHSLCTLEFENNREIYDWLVERLFPAPRPRQIEFARLNLDHTVVSKRKLLKLVQAGVVSGWDDPRMPTLAALRRRGVTPEAIRTFAERVGVTKANSRTDLGLFEASIRNDLNLRAPRTMAVTDPLPLDLTDLPDDARRTISASLWPHDVPHEGERPLPFGRELWIEREDVRLDPPKGWKRLAPGVAVRLRHGPVIVCEGIDVDDAGRPAAVRARTVDDPEAEGVRVRGVVHWVARHAGVAAEFRLVDRLFEDPDPESGGRDVLDGVDPGSLRIRHGFVEPYVADADPDARWQFERQGYFWRDPVDGRGDALVFTRIVTLKDGWSRSTDAARTAKRRSRAEREADEGATPRPVGAGRSPAGRPGDAPDPLAGLDDDQVATVQRWEQEGVPRSDAARIAPDPPAAALFDAAHAVGRATPAGLAGWIVNELPRALDGLPLEEARLEPGALAALVARVEADTISGPVAKELLAELVAHGGDPDALVQERGLAKLDDADALDRAVRTVLDEHPDEVAAYRGGKVGLIGFFVGRAMRATDGRADPKRVRALLEARLGAPD